MPLNISPNICVLVYDAPIEPKYFDKNVFIVLSKYSNDVSITLNNFIDFYNKFMRSLNYSSYYTLLLYLDL